MNRMHSKVREKAMALVLVLAIVVLVTVLIVAFFTSVTSELTTSKAYAGGEQSKQLSDSVVQLVMSQIVQGTTSGTVSPGRLTWASQPGMIRTFDDSGNVGNFYKLYSSAQMIVSGSSFVSGSDVPSYATWSSQPSLYTDLNQPVLTLDPAGVIVTNSGTYTANYPIMDPTGVGNVEGFSISSTSTPTGYTGVYPPSGTYNPVASPNPAPMPVQWLYVLQSGSLAVPASVDPSTGILSFQPGSAPSAGNPIVGRIAFWTDDETCKLNINTASEGTCFDVPRGTIQSEINLAQTMPIIDEFQRTPGHPAMTCLSPALGWITGLQRPASGTFTPSTYNVAEAFYDIAPRTNYLSSNGVDYTTQAGTVQTGTMGLSGTSIAVTPDYDRLYASLDELVFNSSNSFPRPSNPQPQSGVSYTPPVINKQALDQGKFFLTASSRAPETTLFNTPRIGLWPLQVDGTGDAKDQLLKFCTTLGGGTNGYKYYFQRYNETSSGGANWSALDTWGGSPLTAIPSCMSSTVDYSQIQRNKDVYAYLQNLTSQNIPGYGGSFVSKWSALGRDQVLTEMFDWIRGGLAQMPSGLPGQYEYCIERGNGRAERFVAPITIDTTSSGGGVTKGFGRFNTIVQAAIVFYASGTANAISSGSSVPPGQSPYLPPSTTQMQAVMLFMPFHPTVGMWNWSPFCRYDVSFSGFNLSVNGGGSSAFVNAYTRLADAMGGGSEIGGIFPLQGIRDSFRVSAAYATGGNETYKTLNNTSPDQDNNYPFCTAPVTVPVVTGSYSTFNFSGGTLTLKIRSGIGPAASSEVYQTIQMQFPQINNMPVPQSMTVTGTSLSWDSRVQSLGTDFRGIIQDGDIVRAVEVDSAGLANGDFRLIAGQPSVPSSYFHTHPDYNSVVTPYTSSQLDYGNPPSYAPSNTSGTSLNALAAARLGRFAHSLRCCAYTDYQYGIANGTKSVGGATFSLTNRNNISNYPWTGDKINPYPTNASTLQGSGTATVGVPNPGGLVAGVSYYNGDTPVAGHGITAALMSNGKPGDWDSGSGDCPDGPYVNKADPGNLNSGANGPGGYWTTTTSNGDAGASYSPNRMVASPVMFGSLPTPNSSGSLQPWQTLLFCPNPPSGTSHPGFGASVNSGTNGPPYTTPPDYAILDLFTMPIVEPYAISEPLSTAGKVNLNYEIMPFTFVRRDTAVRGVLKSMQMGAIPNTVTSANYGSAGPVTQYKYGDPTNMAYVSQAKTRFSLNLDETNGTLAGFEQKFATGDIFRSAGEICSIFLVPNDTSTNPTYSTISDVVNGWWKNYQLTGDNMRESPYNQIYPRVTTKSNSFTVHYRVQILKKSPPSASTPATGWNEKAETVISEYRGSTLIERYVDPADTNLPDFVANPSLNLDTYYKFRIVSNRKF